MGNKLAAGCLIMFITPFIVIGIGTFSYSVYRFLESLPTHSWQSTPATVTECRIKTVEDIESDSQKVLITYNYTFAGKAYTSAQISIGYSTNNVEYHRELYEVLKNARRIMVYVNPDNPNNAVVVKGTNNSTVFLFLFSIMWNSFLAAFAIPFFLWRKEKVNQLLLDDSSND
jgi:hypothetical protein